MEIGRADDSDRKPYYGEGRQPWDVMLQETPWAPYFAAGCVLRYLRRPTKSPLNDEWFMGWCGLFETAKEAAVEEQRQHSLDSARWYYARLREMSAFGPSRHPMFNLAVAALTLLDDKILTPDERKLLGP